MKTVGLVSGVVAQKGVTLLGKTYPDARCELIFSDAFELLVATVLSAQTTDARVNRVTPELLDRWPTPQKLARADLTEIEKVVKSLGMFRRKAFHIKELSVQLMTDFGGAVPDSRVELMQLAGVGRKTANVVLGNWFGTDEITVDTHVGRVTKRLGWADGKTPAKVETQLWELLPDAPWTQLCHQLISHGRQICHSRTPQCQQCPLFKLCPWDQKTV